MSTRIAYDPVENVAALYDSVSGVAFGEVFETEFAYEDAERFLAWLKSDPRALTPAQLTAERGRFMREVGEFTS